MTGRLEPAHRLLVVEDDADNSHLLQTYFSAHGYTVDVAVRGRAGLDLARQGNYELIILDLNLPEMDGFEVLQALRQSQRAGHIPVIILTERAAQSDRLAGLSLGAHDYVVKPYDLEELRLRVQSAVTRAARDSLLDPRTGLPTGRLIEDHARRVAGLPGWHRLECRIEAFRPFLDLNGFAAGDEVLVFTARLLRDTLAEAGTPDDLIGHPAHDTFLLLTAAADVAALTARLQARFAEGIQAHYSFMDIEQGQIVLRDQDGRETPAPLMTLTVTVR